MDTRFWIGQKVRCRATGQTCIVTGVYHPNAPQGASVTAIERPLHRMATTFDFIRAERVMREFEIEPVIDDPPQPALRRKLPNQHRPQTDDPDQLGCTGCRRVLLKSEFYYFKTAERHDNLCKSCRAAYSRTHRV